MNVYIHRASENSHVLVNKWNLTSVKGAVVMLNENDIIAMH